MIKTSASTRNDREKNHSIPPPWQTSATSVAVGVLQYEGLANGGPSAKNIDRPLDHPPWEGGESLCDRSDAQAQRLRLPPIWIYVQLTVPQPWPTLVGHGIGIDAAEEAS